MTAKLAPSRSIRWALLVAIFFSTSGSAAAALHHHHSPSHEHTADPLGCPICFAVNDGMHVPPAEPPEMPQLSEPLVAFIQARQERRIAVPHRPQYLSRGPPPARP